MSLEGQQLGEFEIVECLGRGGMGAVYKARQVSLDRLVALKTLQAAIAADPEYIARFRREAKAAGALNHPNLVQVYSAGENQGLHWFAMEYVEGESAQARLKRKGRLDPEEAIAIATHVAAALDYAWRKAQLIHRDIKPDNIFLSIDGEVKLGDLGLAKSAGETHSITMTGSSMGTPDYVSPEQAEGRKDVDLRADIYSLGCTLFHLSSGEAPFHGDTALAVMMKHVSAPVPNLRQVWPECPEELARVVMKMMFKPPSARQQSYEEVIADLRRAFDCLTGAAIPSVIAVTQQPAARKRAPQPAPVARQPIVAKRRTPVGALAIGGLALFAAVVALFWVAPWKKGGVASSAPAAGATNAPFVNTLGMKFVPVPILGGPTAGQRVLFSVWDTRVQDYAAYAGAKNADDSWTKQAKDGVSAGREPTHPVVGVSWEEAQAFCQWLTEKETAEGKLPKGMKYRLPSDEEWSWAVGLPPELGATPAEKNGKNNVDFPWGKDYPPRGKVGNYADEAFHAKFPPKKNENENRVEDLWIEGYTDGFATTAPVGSFPANAYGLYDMGGNAWQWCEDWLDAAHEYRVLRGASWNGNTRFILLSSNRGRNAPMNHNNYDGFRCVLAPVESESGFMPLFDANGIQAWRQEGGEAKWEFSDGVLSCRNETPKAFYTSRLRCPKILAFADYEIRFAVRGHPGPSFEFRGASDNMGDSYRLDPGNVKNRAALFWNGKGFSHPNEPLALAGQRVRITREGVPEELSKMNTPSVWKDGGWNEVILVVQGNHFSYTCNGILAAEVIDESSSYRAGPGDFAFRVGNTAEGTTSGDFKDMRIRRLPAPAAYPQPARSPIRSAVTPAAATAGSF